MTIPARSANGTETASNATFKRVAWRIMPLLLVSYVVAYLDRVNIGFAKLQMLDDLRFSDAVYGLGAGLFFFGYFLFEVPSNLLLHRLGARRWIARIMFTWAALSMATAWVTSPTTFYAVRFALGVAEAGFFPGIILYLTYWFPPGRRGRMTAMLVAGNPISGIIGGPLSGYIMRSFGGAFGLSGWQWLFIIEALPAVALGAAVYFYFDDRVSNAAWLDDGEKAAIHRELAEDAALLTLGSVRSVFTSVRVWLLCLIFFCIVVGSYAIGFWQPTIIRNSGVADPFIVGMLSMIPYALALISMMLVSRSADRTRERRWHVGIPCLLGAVGFCICALSVNQLIPSMAGLILAAVGVVSALPTFWALPTAFLGGRGAAAGIALVNSVGNLGGFASPAGIGWLVTRTHSFTSGLFLVAASLILAALLIVTLIPARIVNR